ncbi:hypothetical protein [Roseibium sp. RKSG952]|uniref:hypothetical protein n=1 Tax=Roseibium sp. RKSG952 TaxID=2529384 RepID=UPI0012BBA8A7|nr:hypothetical protein [Roseibium sp. RKSG952]MTH95990.1 hypothetical protein [Roseibium sp. RKSG952]
MSTFTVHHRNDGSFEAASIEDPIVYRVLQDESIKGGPWVLVSRPKKGSHDGAVLGSVLEGAFESLDSALESAVCKAVVEEEAPRFRVEMTDGASFQRPGCVSAESVLAGLGWINVREMVGRFVFSGPEEMTEEDASHLVSIDLDKKSLVIGSIDFLKIEDGNSHWCADLKIPYNGFLRSEIIESMGMSAFSEQGLNVACIEWTTRVPVKNWTADIVDLAQWKIANDLTRDGVVETAAV